MSIQVELRVADTRVGRLANPAGGFFVPSVPRTAPVVAARLVQRAPRFAALVARREDAVSRR